MTSILRYTRRHKFSTIIFVLLSAMVMLNTLHTVTKEKGYQREKLQDGNNKENEKLQESNMLQNENIRDSGNVKGNNIRGEDSPSVRKSEDDSSNIKSIESEYFNNVEDTEDEYILHLIIKKDDKRDKEPGNMKRNEAETLNYIKENENEGSANVKEYEGEHSNTENGKEKSGILNANNKKEVQVSGTLDEDEHSLTSLHQSGHPNVPNLRKSEDSLSGVDADSADGLNWLSSKSVNTFQSNENGQQHILTDGEILGHEQGERKPKPPNSIPESDDAVDYYHHLGSDRGSEGILRREATDRIGPNNQDGLQSQNTKSEFNLSLKDHHKFPEDVNGKSQTVLTKVERIDAINIADGEGSQETEIHYEPLKYEDFHQNLRESENDGQNQDQMVGDPDLGQINGEKMGTFNKPLDYDNPSDFIMREAELSEIVDVVQDNKNSDNGKENVDEYQPHNLEEDAQLEVQENKETFEDLNDYAFPLDIDTKPVYILWTRWRSGSSFLGELIAKSKKNTFYSFEPLYFYNDKIFDSSGEQTREALDYVKALLRCHVNQNEKIFKAIYGLKPYLFLKANPMVSRYCRPVDVCRDADVIKELCDAADQHLIKLLRLSLKFGEELLSENPFVKIIYLVRDPRAVLRSRTLETWCLSPDCRDPARVCQLYAEDLIHAIALSHSYPERFLFVRYEDLSLDVENELTKILDFLAQSYAADDELEKLVREYSANGASIVIGTKYDTKRDSKKQVFHWRERANYHFISQIQEDCGHILDALGYRQYRDVTEYNDRTLSPVLQYKPLCIDDKKINGNEYIAVLEETHYERS